MWYLFFKEIYSLIKNFINKNIALISIVTAIGTCWKIITTKDSSMQNVIPTFLLAGIGAIIGAIIFDTTVYMFTKRKK